MSFQRTLSLARRGMSNFLSSKPFCVSFEITYACNACCRHCHLGGPVKETQAAPERFGEIRRELRPVVAQVSGGEPLLRKDLSEIIHALRDPGRDPYIVLTTNGVLLKPAKFRELREAGVDSFSLSLDYPDERHDDFRRVPGLLSRIDKLIGELDPRERKAITLSCVVQRDNFMELPKIADVAVRWGVRVNFSTYTWLRVGNRDFMLKKEDFPEFDRVVEQLLKCRRQHRNVFATEYVFSRMRSFFSNGGIPNCRAGEKFLIVNPDGSLSPCGLILKKFDSQKEMITQFSRNNRCGDCNTSIRANSEKPITKLVVESLKALQ